MAANINEYIQKIEAATDGKAMRSEMIAALNAVNGSVDDVPVYSKIPIDKVKSICTR